ncbi:MAG: hypothetical protein SFU53_15025 [Terrimicrobiaceae bacterium]|nr:hypothetical protein [Terrimicrobiaceae bacterium]
MPRFVDASDADRIPHNGMTSSLPEFIAFLYTGKSGGRSAIEAGAGSLRKLAAVTRPFLCGGIVADEAAERRKAGFDTLKAYATENGLFLARPFFKRLANERSQIGAGAEHTVFFDPRTQRVIKLTHEDVFGDGTLGAKGGAGEYFEALFLCDALVGDGTFPGRFEGLVTMDGGSVPQVVTSHRYVKGRKAKNSEIVKDLVRQGFTRVEARRDVNLWEHRPAGVKIYDAVPSNVLYDDFGVLHYIDVDLIPTREREHLDSERPARGVEKLLSRARERNEALQRQPAVNLAEARAQGLRNQREESDLAL